MSQGNPTLGDFDEVDLALLKRIEEDFDVSLDTLSGELELSKSAIHYRMSKLRDEGVIKGLTADLNPDSFGMDMVAITEVSVTHEHGYSDEIGEKLAEIDGVEQVYFTMGDVDFTTISRVQNRGQMNRILEAMVAIDGVNETSSRFVMSEIQSNPRVATIMSDEMKDLLLNADK